LRQQFPEPAETVVGNEGELVRLLQAGEQAVQEELGRDVAQLEIGERKEIVHHADHPGLGTALDRHPRRRIDHDDIVAARVDPRRRQAGQRRHVLVAVEAGLEQEVLEQLEMAQVGGNIFEPDRPVLDQPGMQPQKPDRTQEAGGELPGGCHVNPVPNPVEHPA